MYKKVKDFVVKYWQWFVLGLTSLAFYLFGRSKDTKDEEVKLATLSKELEQKKTQEILEGWLAKEKDKSDSIAENILQFEEKKGKDFKGCRQHRFGRLFKIKRNLGG